jgi:dihydroorotate dehydrogenase (NAD+) catalytic subunit
LKHPDFAVTLGPLQLKNPLLLASGTWGFGEGLAKHCDLRLLGGLVTKGISLDPRPGNPPPRLAETPCGLVNAIGLENPGLSNVAGTVLNLLGYENVKDYDPSLISFN